MIPWAHPSHQLTIPNGISSGSAVFAGLTNVTNRQTDRQTDHVCSNKPLSLAVAAMRPINVGGDYKMLNVVDNVSVADVADIVVKTDFGI